jgi:hypothetical protein
MKKQQVLPVILTLVIMTIATTTLASIADVNAQSSTGDTEQQSSTGDTEQQDAVGDTEQIKEYLNQAILAIDDGNNTLALEQVDLASDALESMTGSADAGEEGAGEDADEAGDDDTNDEEDSESK